MNKIINRIGTDNSASESLVIEIVVAPSVTGPAVGLTVEMIFGLFTVSGIKE